jgi:hypothetical protein
VKSGQNFLWPLELSSQLGGDNCFRIILITVSIDGTICIERDGRLYWYVMVRSVLLLQEMFSELVLVLEADPLETDT